MQLSDWLVRFTLTPRNASAFSAADAQALLQFMKDWAAAREGLGVGGDCDTEDERFRYHAAVCGHGGRLIDEEEMRELWREIAAQVSGRAVVFGGFQRFTFTWNRFEHLWSTLGLRPPEEELFDAIMDAYEEPDRAYHTEQHIEECLLHLDGYGGHEPEVELALWFHDIVYDPRAHDNEQRSAEWAVRVLQEKPSLAETVKRLILVTRHHAVPAAPDEQLLTDIDLSILGAPPERFEDYERQIRREYNWVPEEIYRRERAKVLQKFRDRKFIYSTEYFRDLLEAQARRNLARP
jgi:predicted metal-dependent HD superfamily phosphohydrolase